jgi:Fe-S oxidoreductase
VRQAPEDALIVADGSSCRQQIRHATGRDPKHLVEVVAAKIGVDQ